MVRLLVHGFGLELHAVSSALPVARIAILVLLLQKLTSFDYGTLIVL